MRLGHRRGHPAAADHRFPVGRAQRAGRPDLDEAHVVDAYVGPPTFEAHVLQQHPTLPRGA